MTILQEDSMSFTLDDPTALPPIVTQGMRPYTRPWPDDPEPLQRLVDALMPPITRAADAEDAAALEVVRSAPEYGPLSDVGRATRELFLALGAATRAAGADRNLTAAGRTDAIAKARATCEAGLQRIAGMLSKQGDALLSRFPAEPMPLLPADLAPVASFVVSAADAMLPGAFLRKAGELLRRATDPAVPAAERFRCNLLLAEAYQPLLERLGQSPPEDWVGFGDVASAFGALEALIEMHLRTVWQRARSEVAIQSVAQFRADFTYLVTQARELGGWDDTFQVATPRFTWPQPNAA